MGLRGRMRLPRSSLGPSGHVSLSMWSSPIAFRRADLTAFTARQIHSLGDKQLSARIEKIWGRIRETPAERARLIANYKRRLTPAALAGDRQAGRMLFDRHCANCHRLFDAGTAVGPDLTGAQRTNVDYLLLNLIDPSSSISNDFRMQVIETTEGRVVTGLVVAESDNAITIQTANEKIVIPTAEVERRVLTGISMMPEGLLQQLTPTRFEISSPISPVRNKCRRPRATVHRNNHRRNVASYSLPAPRRSTSSSPGRPKEYRTPVYFFGKKARSPRD